MENTQSYEDQETLHEKFEVFHCAAISVFFYQFLIDIMSFKCHTIPVTLQKM